MARKLSRVGSSHGASVAGAPSSDAPRPSARARAPAQPARAASPPADSSPREPPSTDVAYKKMTWSMLLPSQGDLRHGGTVEAVGDTVPGDLVPDTAEFHHLQKDEAERQHVEAGAVAANCQADVLLFSDTISTDVRSKLKSRLKSCAQHIEVRAIPPHVHI